MIFYGINPVAEALRARRLLSHVYLAAGKDSPRLRQIMADAQRLKVPVEAVADLDRRCGTREHQGVAAECPELGIAGLNESPTAPGLVMLDGLQDPQNFGAALRVCEVFGYPEVIYHRGNSCGVTPAAIKASAGAVFHLQLYESNLSRAAIRLQDWGYSVVVLEADAGQDLFTAELPDKYCLVVGSEGGGVRHVLQRRSDLQLRIPMRGRVSSLNVSCALAVALAVLSRRLPPVAGVAP